MTDTQAMRELLVKVEAGWPLDIDTPYMRPFHSVWPDWRAQSAWLANNGSLDAAKALHDAVLPGWFPGMSQNIHSGHWFVWVQDKSHHFSSTETCPARAWLICIIRALIAQATP